MNAGSPVPEADPLALLAAWREQAEADPLAACVIEALLRRAAACAGPQRRLLVQRAQARMAALAAPTGLTVPAVTVLAPPAAPTALQGLSELVDRLGRAATTATTAAAAATPASSVPALKAVAAHKRTWMRLRAEQRLRQATAQVPAAPGPLNASHLVNRLLQTLHTLSPDYLDAFMAQVDALLWLEQASGAGLADLQRAGGSTGRRSGSPSSAAPSSSRQRRHRQPV
ncbi:DUF2894 domain-containing protein [Pseudorhodoferax sp.]|uniref:DUF2894 domain-containing protein n=1 Tax=Pseudorhodoferax sp. TaxID=1993553 RepID=UPI002DD6890F|nr:DUF2894 domain-containing protein [Pseudorhodoferax sp.]